ncbi:MAG: DUF3108 domain-containing protein [Candidatus Velamenicoccus archaeovorus]
MKFYRVLLVVFIVGAAAGGFLFFSPTPSVLLGPTEARPAAARKTADTTKTVFPARETISFGVYSNIIKVGSGVLTYAGRDESREGVSQHVRLRVETFSVNDTEDVYGSEDFKFPHKVERRVRLFGKQEAIEETYAAGSKSVLIAKTTDGKASQTETISSDTPLENVLLLIYRLRNDPDMAVGKTYAVNLPTQKFELTVKSKTSLKVPLGRFSVFYIESQPSKYKIWLTDDPKRIPVRIQGLISFGMFYLAATSVETP